MSQSPAKYFSKVGLKAMQDRGRMQEGKIADITIFNPDTVAETSSMKEGERGSYTKGIPYVLINGQVVIDNGVFEVAFAYSDDTERDRMLTTIAAATGLNLPDS